MGEMYIYDIVGQHLPGHLSRSMNAAKLLTSKTNYEIMVAALEKYFKELGLGENDSQLEVSYLPWLGEKKGFHYLCQKVRLKNQIE